LADEWMPWLELRLSPLEFQQLPRNAAYRYQYQAGAAWLNPRPRYFHAMLDLRAVDLRGAADVTLRGMHADDLGPLEGVFSDAFRAHQPFAGLTEAGRLLAARNSLQQVRSGGDGPWIERASFVALGEDGSLLGGVLVTLLPLRDPTDVDCYSWDSPPPPEAAEQRLGRPHLTWIFVRSGEAGRGVGTALLGAVCRELADKGYQELLSTFMLGNDSSMLWHWRSGFRLLRHPGSMRRGDASREKG
jgi:hypothetical protein